MTETLADAMRRGSLIAELVAAKADGNPETFGAVLDAALVADESVYVIIANLAALAAGLSMEIWHDDHHGGLTDYITRLAEASYQANHPTNPEGTEQ
ncbi:MAG: hypothetical protein FWD85_11140 [Microbacteriaceae bacterium]|nr:hypothetical protein [Microbacteriaceae bacterium]